MILAGRIILRWTPLDIPILLFLLSQVVSTIYSIDPHISWFGWYGRFNGGLVSTISYTVLYYAFVANISENSENSESRKVRKSDNQKTGASGSLNLRFSDFSGFRSIPSVPIFAILSSATIVSLYAIFQHFGIDRDFWIQDVETRVFSTQGQPNWLAGFLVMIIPLTWMLTTKSKEQRAKSGNKNMIVFCFLFFVFFTAFLFTKSRSGLLGFAVMDVVFWLTVFAINNKQKPKSKNLKSFVFIHSIILILVFITNNPARDWFFKTIQRVDNQSEQSVISNQQLAINLRKSELGGTESGDIRRIVWNGALEIAKRNPIFGTGPETFGLTYWQVRPKEANQTSEWNFLYNKAHNEYLNYLATTGFVGLLSYLFLIGSVFYILIKAIINEKDKNNKLIYIVLLASYITILASNFFGFSTTTINLFFYLIPAFIGAKIIKEQKEFIFKNKPFIFQIFGVSLGLVLLFFLTSYYIADLNYAKSEKASQIGDYQSAATYLDQANRLHNSHIYLNSYSLNVANLAVLISYQKDNKQSKDLMRLALQKSNEAISASPKNVNYLKNKSKIEYLFYQVNSQDRKYVDDAISTLKQAQELSPTDAKIPYSLSIFYTILFDFTKDAKYKDLSFKEVDKSIDLKSNFTDAYTLKTQLLDKYTNF